jgi:hypothetical protein
VVKKGTPLPVLNKHIQTVSQTLSKQVRGPPLQWIALSVSSETVVQQSINGVLLIYSGK